MLLVPDFGIVSLLVWTLIGVPVVVCAIITILACNAGAQANHHLPLIRHLYATTVGSFVGLISFAATIFLGQLTVMNVTRSFFFMVFAMVVVVPIATLLGGFSGFQVSKLPSGGLNVYECDMCHMRFRANFPSEQCSICAAISDRVNLSTAMRQMADNLENLNDPPATSKN